MYALLFPLPPSLFLQCVLFLSSVQSGWMASEMRGGLTAWRMLIDGLLCNRTRLDRTGWVVTLFWPRALSFSPLFLKKFSPLPCISRLTDPPPNTLPHTQCINKHVCSDCKHTSSLCFFSPPPRLLCSAKRIIVAIIHSSPFPFFLPLPILFSLSLLLQDRFCPVSHFIRFHFTALIHTVWNTGHSQEKFKMTPADKSNATFDVVHQPVPANLGIYWRLQFNKFMRDKVSLTRHTILNCGSACFFRQWFSASILHTTIVIYGNYPSLGSSINWLLLGDGSSCCLVRGSSTVRGNAGEFKRRHLWRMGDSGLCR